jgi:hypothetical protein
MQSIQSVSIPGQLQQPQQSQQQQQVISKEYYVKVPKYIFKNKPLNALVVVYFQN